MGVRLILGTAQLTRPYGILHPTQPSVSGDSASRVLQSAKAERFDGIDTAPVYGRAEDIIGREGLGLPVHTKLEPGVDGIRSIQQSMSRLAVDYLEVVYQHTEFDGSDRQLRELERIRELSRETVRSIGASVYTPREFDLALNCEAVSAIQLPLSIANQVVDDKDLHAATLQGKRIYARSIFLQGVLLVPPDKLPPAVSGLRDYVRRFHALAARFELTPLQASLAYVRSYQGLSGVVVGANTVANVAEISEAFSRDVVDQFVEECRNLDEPNKQLTDPRTWQ